ncbi:unnamed protein product [Bursaphelenchus okinawaensis]|uniref:Ig-like domain-containing protein n=1 Tax=Bursaphelenchus okinawaensis TaxID=465554 RepID=A0A811L8B8_9BILA|nr:unnamed protein product [Bursaphelenchus okinawaensis]CAG9121005.1 unnamed protein product [Bursaphelenchus okinawaensis]
MLNCVHREAAHENLQYQHKFFCNAKKNQSECEKLPVDELKRLIREGECKPIQIVRKETTTTTVKPPSRRILSTKSKRKMMKVIYFGNQRFLNISMNSEDNEKHHYINIVEGSFVELKCNANASDYNETETLPKWYVDGEDIRSFLGWRVQLADNNTKLFFTPILHEFDSGLFECFVDNKIAGFVNLKVNKMFDSVLEGMLSYFTVILIGSPIFLLITVCRTCTRDENNLVQTDPLFMEEDPEKQEDYEEMMMNVKDAELLK